MDYGLSHPLFFSLSFPVSWVPISSLLLLMVIENGFQANGAWTNLTPYTNRHAFVDTGAATNSGWPVATQRNYRVWVGLP